MRILILSDSHGNVENMVRAVEAEHPDQIFHLGDVWRDAEKLAQRFPEIPLFQVPGNCDYRPDAPKVLLTGAEELRILLCHGHTYGVKSSLLAAGFAAEEQNADVFCFGHTHRPLVDKRGKTLFVNPGAAGDYRMPTYAVLTVEGSRADARIVLLDS